MAKAEVIQLVGDAITNFTEVQCLTPRYLSRKVLFVGSSGLCCHLQKCFKLSCLAMIMSADFIV